MVGSAEPFRVGWQGAVCRTGGAGSKARREIPGDDRFHRVHRRGDAGTGPGEKTLELAPARQFKAVEQIAAEMLAGRANLAEILGPSLDQGANLAAVVRMIAPGEVETLLSRDPRMALMTPRIEGPAARLAIKWPNDVLLNGGKVAGILLESAGSGGQVTAVAVGIGVNLAAVPDTGTIEPGAITPVSVLGETGFRTAPEDFLDLLAPAFALLTPVAVRLGYPEA